MNELQSHQWLPALTDLWEAGFTYFDFLTAIDRESPTGDADLEVVVRVTTEDFTESRTYSTRLRGNSPTLESIKDVYTGADWHERETAEMFGIHFTGNNAQPLLRHLSLLRHQPLGAPPLRKSVILSTRVVTEWPGAAEPEIKSDGRKVGNPSRRRQRPPGVPENWLQGN